MICPYCDSQIDALPDNRVCPRCCAPLGVAERQTIAFPPPPLGKYKQPFRYIEIQEEGVRFYEKFLRLKNDRMIPYQQLTAVKFQPGTKDTLGFLSVRDWRDRDVPLPRTHREAVNDNTSVIFGDYFNARYGRIYEFLKQCAEIANRARGL